MSDSSREEICAQLRQALELRQKYCDAPKKQTYFPDTAKVELCWKDGLMQVRCLIEAVRSSETETALVTKGIDSQEVFGDQEAQDAMDTGHRDFYNVRKVDTHIHHSAAMNAKHLLRFMKKKLKRFSEDIVDEKDGCKRTLKRVFDEARIAWTDLCIDRLQVWADKSCLHRFDRFNNKYSPMGQNELRAIFLKTDNAMGGRYLAELSREARLRCVWALDICKSH
eukprot:g6836.t1